jgi:hypothetical protein
VDNWLEQQPQHKRHIFYTGGWGAGGGALGVPIAELNAINPARKSRPDQGFRPDMDNSPARPVSGGSAGNAGRLRQLFVSRGWGPSWK